MTSMAGDGHCTEVIQHRKGKGSGARPEMNTTSLKPGLNQNKNMHEMLTKKITQGRKRKCLGDLHQELEVYLVQD